MAGNAFIAIGRRRKKMTERPTLIGRGGKARIRAKRDYSREGGKFLTLSAAYRQYQRDRLADTPNPTLAPRNRFAQIWGWTKAKGK